MKIVLHINKNSGNTFYSRSMSEEIKLNSSEESEISYDKAKDYWQNVEPTVCGMLGGLPEVGFIGKLLISSFVYNFHDDNLF